MLTAVTNIIRIHPLRTTDASAKFQGNPSKSFWEISLKRKRKTFQDEKKVGGSPKSLGCNIWEPEMCTPNVVAVQVVDVQRNFDPLLLLDENDEDPQSQSLNQ